MTNLVRMDDYPHLMQEIDRVQKANPYLQLPPTMRMTTFERAISEVTAAKGRLARIPLDGRHTHELHHRVDLLTYEVLAKILNYARKHHSEDIPKPGFTDELILLGNVPLHLRHYSSVFGEPPLSKIRPSEEQRHLEAILDYLSKWKSRFG